MRTLAKKKLRLALVLMGALGLGTSATANDDHRNSPTLVGTWRLTVTLPAGASVCPPAGAECTFLALATATGDRTVIQTAPIPNTTIGHGVWAHTGPRSFLVRSTYLRLAPDGPLIGSAEATTRISLARDGWTAAGTYENVLFDLLGVEVGRFSASVSAVRMVP